MIRTAARYGYQVTLDVWDGIKSGVDQLLWHAPTGVALFGVGYLIGQVTR